MTLLLHRGGNSRLRHATATPIPLRLSGIQSLLMVVLVSVPFASFVMWTTSIRTASLHELGLLDRHEQAINKNVGVGEGFIAVYDYIPPKTPKQQKHSKSKSQEWKSNLKSNSHQSPGQSHYATQTEPPFLSPIQPHHLQPHRPPMVHLDVAHRMGLYHFGAWVFVMDANEKILLLKRANHLVTCPNTWGPMGEHRHAEEPHVHTVIRGMTEELGLHVTLEQQQTPLFRRSYDNKDVHTIQVTPETLTPYPLFYKRAYGPTNGNRIDRQVTHLWKVQLPLASHDMLPWRRKTQPTQQSQNHEKKLGLVVDDEVEDVGWFTLDHVERWMEEKPQDFCHGTIRELLRPGLEALKRQILPKNETNNMS